MERTHSETEYKDLLAELQTTNRKLQSKIEALLLVSQDLATCQIQKDKYEQRSDRLQALVEELEETVADAKEERCRKDTLHAEERAASLSLNSALRRENRQLSEENQSLKNLLNESKGDSKLLRQKLARQQLHEFCNGDEDVQPSKGGRTGSQSTVDDAIACTSPTNTVPANIIVSGSYSSTNRPSSQSDEDTKLEEIERLKQQYVQLERDLRSVLCEKEELIDDRAALAAKCTRLTAELGYLLSGDDRRVLGDLDALLAENRYLKQRLETAQEETGLARAALNRYRQLMDKRKSKSGNLLTSSLANAVHNSDASSSSSASPLTLVTPKQIEEMLSGGGSSDWWPHGEQSADFKALATALFDSVKDKSLLLSHQRKANKILGSRITELETRLRQLESDRSPAKNQQLAEIENGLVTSKANLSTEVTNSKSTVN